MPHSFRTQKRLGQNFLFDKNILAKMVSALGLQAGDTILEIGAGLGTLTELLAEKPVKAIALEIDKRAADLLKDKFKEKNVAIINEDFLQYMISSKFIKKKLKVIGNIPYYITTPIIERLFNFRDRIATIFITVQKEVAERIAASPGTKKYGSLTCFVRYYANPEILFYIKAGSFSPAPKVESAFLKLELFKKPPYAVDNEELFFKMIRRGFGQRRKTFVNALSPLVKKEAALFAIRGLGLKPDIRIERLSLENLRDIFILLDSNEGNIDNRGKVMYNYADRLKEA